jgi:hypothetical protein
MLVREVTSEVVLVVIRRRITVSKLRMLRGRVLFVGIVAGLLGSVALAPSAYAQSYWNGVAPTTPGPVTDYGYGNGAGGPYDSYGPNWGGWAAAPGGNNVPGTSTPYWLGAPQAVGPGY